MEAITMGIESLKNKVYKRGDFNNSKSNYVDIGNYIKKRRKELNITQDEVTEGICSISYLSDLVDRVSIWLKLPGSCVSVLYTVHIKKQSVNSKFLSLYLFFSQSVAHVRSLRSCTVEDKRPPSWLHIREVSHLYLITFN